MNSDQRKILFIIDGLNGGGKERQLVEILKILNQNREIVTGVITFNKNRHYSGTVSELVPFFIELRKRPTRTEPFFTIWKYIRKFKPDIIHTWDSLSSLYVWFPATLFKLPVIDGSIRDSGVDKGWQLWIKRYFLKRAALVISNSNAGLTYYNMQGQVVYNAINPNRFPKKNEEGLVNAIMVANFTDYKDHATFIRAAIVLLEKGVLDHVYLVGDGPTRSKHQESIAKYAATTISKIHFQGAINNVEEILSNCRYGILCSTVTYSEGVSNAILEYMAAGLIPIATNVGGTPEIIKNGRNGYLTGAGNHEQIVNIIADLEKDPRQRSKIVTEAKQTIVEKFSYEGNVEKLINFYKQICRKN